MSSTSTSTRTGNRSAKNRWFSYAHKKPYTVAALNRPFWNLEMPKPLHHRFPRDPLRTNQLAWFNGDAGQSSAIKGHHSIMGGKDLNEGLRLRGALIRRISEHRTSKTHSKCGTELDAAVIFKHPMKARKSHKLRHRQKSAQWKQEQVELRTASISAVQLCKTLRFEQSSVQTTSTFDHQQCNGPCPCWTNRVPAETTAAVSSVSAAAIDERTRAPARARARAADLSFGPNDGSRHAKMPRRRHKRKVPLTRAVVSIAPHIRDMITAMPEAEQRGVLQKLDGGQLVLLRDFPAKVQALALEVWRLKQCTTCREIMCRDVNASRNMALRAFMIMAYGTDGPHWLLRKADRDAWAEMMAPSQQQQQQQQQ